MTSDRRCERITHAHVYGKRVPIYKLKKIAIKLRFYINYCVARNSSTQPRSASDIPSLPALCPASMKLALCGMSSFSNV